MLGKLLLKFLIRIVNAQLLEGVLFEYLKAEYIQEADKLSFALRLFNRAIADRDGLVNLLDNPVKNFTVKMLTERVTGHIYFLFSQRD